GSQRAAPGPRPEPSPGARRDARDAARHGRRSGRRHRPPGRRSQARNEEDAFLVGRPRSALHGDRRRLPVRPLLPALLLHSAAGPGPPLRDPLLWDRPLLLRSRGTGLNGLATLLAALVFFNLI